VRFEFSCPQGRADWAPALIVAQLTPAVTFKQTREFVRAWDPPTPSPDSACRRMWAESAGWGTCEPSHTYRASPSHPLCCSLPSAGAFPRFPAPHLNYPALAPTLQRGVRRRGVHSCVCDAL
jgi:hypothetical protein